MISKSYSEQKQDWSIHAWLRLKGITVADLEKHPAIDDVIQLLNIRDYLWERMNFSEQATWGAYWNTVYHKRRFLRDKAWQKFSAIATAIDQREVNKQSQLKQIHRLRLNTEPLKGSQDMTAKGLHLPRVTHTKREQQACREVQGKAFWG
jgi:hypothetical protein